MVGPASEPVVPLQPSAAFPAAIRTTPMERQQMMQEMQQMAAMAQQAQMQGQPPEAGAMPAAEGMMQ